jgi:hypothetical protein
MPVIRRKSSENSASYNRHRKSIKVSYAYDSSSESEEYLDLDADSDVASRSESNNDSSPRVFTVKPYVSLIRRGAAKNATEATAEPIAINGILLRPTVAFDTFWRFAAERKAIDDRRRAGESAP